MLFVKKLYHIVVNVQQTIQLKSAKFALEVKSHVRDFSLSQKKKIYIYEIIYRRLLYAKKYCMHNIYMCVCVCVCAIIYILKIFLYKKYSKTLYIYICAIIYILKIFLCKKVIAHNID